MYGQKYVAIVDNKHDADYLVHFVKNSSSEKNTYLLYNCTLIKRGITDDPVYNRAIKLFITDDQFQADIFIKKENFFKEYFEPEINDKDYPHKVPQQSNRSKEQSIEKQIETTSINEPKEYEHFAPASMNFRSAIRWILCVALILFVVALVMIRFVETDQPQSEDESSLIETEDGSIMESPNDSGFDTVPEDAIGAVYVKVDELYVRSMPSTDGNTPKRFAEKDGVYYVYDIVQDDEYTWYKIGEDEWIADHDREWAEFFQDLN